MAEDETTDEATGMSVGRDAADEDAKGSAAGEGLVEEEAVGEGAAGDAAGEGAVADAGTSGVDDSETGVADEGVSQTDDAAGTGSDTNVVEDSAVEDADTVHDAGNAGDSGEAAVNADSGFDESKATLNEMYDHLRHSTDTAELDAFAMRPLPDPKDAAAFSRATALLEAVAGNLHTSVEKRIYLAESMRFPNILVKLSSDPDKTVRAAVAANTDDKNWLVGLLTKDPDVSVRESALKNKQTSWKMRMEGAEDPQIGPETLDFLAQMGLEEDFKGPAVLAAMVRRAVALNPNASEDTLHRLAQDSVPDVRHAAEQHLSEQHLLQ